MLGVSLCHQLRPTIVAPSVHISKRGEIKKKTGQCIQSQIGQKPSKLAVTPQSHLLVAPQNSHPAERLFCRRVPEVEPQGGPTHSAFTPHARY